MSSLTQLRADNKPVEVFDDQLRKLATEMLLVMDAATGIGLAAPQVGVNIRLMVFDEKGARSAKKRRAIAATNESRPETEYVLVNPVITALSNKTALAEEGCLSFPQVYGKVERPVWVQVSYQDLSGEKLSKKLVGHSAVIFQHEYDHLDKVLFIDKLIGPDKAINQKRLDKMVLRFGPDAAV